MSNTMQTTTNTTSTLIKWEYDFRGKRYGSAIGKKPEDSVTDPEAMHQYIDAVAKQMHETLDTILQQEKKRKQIKGIDK